MKLALALLLASTAVRAGELAEIPRLDVGVSPALVPALAEPNSPTVALLEDRAQVLVSQAARGQAEKYLAELASPKSAAADRLAAGALARLAVEPGLAASLAPVSGLLARLPYALTGGGPYRGAPASSLSSFSKLAMAARRDESVSALFDGARERLKLDEAGMDGARLRIQDKKTKVLRRGAESDAFEHSGKPGVAVEVYHEALAADDVSQDIMRSEARAIELARAGIGPRVLGTDVLFSKGFGPKPMRVASLREAFRGDTASDLTTGWFPDEARTLVVGAIESAARAGYDVTGLSMSHVVVGETALKGLKRAVIVDSSGLKPQPVRAWAEKAAKDWIDRFDQAAADWRRRARMESLLMR